MPQQRILRQTFVLALVAALALLISGCGKDKFAENDAQSKAPMGKVTIVGQQFTEAQVMTALYGLLLRDAGYQTTVKNFSTRDVYLPVLEKGQVQVSADYLSSFTEALNRKANGPDAQPVSSPDTEATLEVLKSLATPRGVTPLEPAEAANANAYAVTAKYAETHRLRTLSDLAALGQPIALAANSDCSTRQDCAKGLKEVYGIEISKIEPLGFGSAETKRALTDGKVELAQVSSTDGTLDAAGIVVLEDDKQLQNAENLVPIVNSAWIKDNPKAADALNKLSEELTTGDLARMNAKVDAERLKPDDVARQFLKDKGLI